VRSNQVAKAMEFKTALEHDFESSAGLESRAFYSAIYSLPQRSPVIWINLNPGGTPDDHQVLSDDALSRGRHEFWHGNGKTSIATGKFIEKIFNEPIDKLLSVQGSNVVWERSRRGEDINLRRAAERTAPFLARYLRYVRPQAIIFGGSAAFDLFVKVHRARVIELHEQLMGNWGPKPARIFIAAKLDIPGIGKVESVTVSHPSRGVRDGVISRCQRYLAMIKREFVTTQ